MTHPSPLPLPSPFPDISAETLGHWRAGKAPKLACCLPFGANASYLSPLYLEEDRSYARWRVTSQMPADQDRLPDTRYMDGSQSRTTPFDILWNQCSLSAPDPWTGDAEAKFWLRNTGQSTIILCRQSCILDYTTVEIYPNEECVLHGHDIIALEAEDGANFNYYVFRELFDLCPQLSIHERYQFLRRIGHGSYGVVFLAKDRRVGSLVAVKRLRWPAREARGVQGMRNEFEQLERLKSAGSSEYITEILDNDPVRTIPSGNLNRLREYAFMHITLEYCSGGSLRQYVRHLPQTLTESEISYIGKQILRGLHAAHQHDVVHRDMKPDNLVLSWTPEKNIYAPCADGREQEHDIRNWTVKLADFGSSTRRRADEICPTPGIGTIAWLPPELDLLNGGSGIRTHKSDIWTAGFIIAALLVNEEVPEQGPTEVMIQSDEKFSVACRIVMDGLLQTNPNDRLSIPDALALPWFSNLDLNSLYAAPQAPATQDVHAVADPATNESIDGSLTLFAEATNESQVHTLNNNTLMDGTITESHLIRNGLYDVTPYETESSGEERAADENASDAEGTPIAIPAAPPAPLTPPLMPYSGDDAPPIFFGFQTIAPSTAESAQSEHSLVPHPVPSPAGSLFGLSSTPTLESVIPDPTPTRRVSAVAMASSRSVRQTQSETGLLCSRSGAGGRYSSLRETHLSNGRTLRTSRGRGQFRKLKRLGRLDGVDELGEEDGEANEGNEMDMMDMTE